MGQKPKKSHQSTKAAGPAPAARPKVMGVLCVGGGGVKWRGGGGEGALRGVRKAFALLKVFFGPSSYPVTTEV